VEAEIVSRRLSANGKSPIVSKRFLRSLKTDNFVGMTLASVTAWFIVIVCASVLFKNGIKEINNAADAAGSGTVSPRFSQRRVGRQTDILIRHYWSGLTGCTGVSWLVFLRTLRDFRLARRLVPQTPRAVGFYGIITVATLVGLSINFLGIDPMKALVFTAVFNGIAAVPLLLMIARSATTQNHGSV